MYSVGVHFLTVFVMGTYHNLVSKWFDSKVLIFVTANNKVTHRCRWVIQIIHFVSVYCVYQSAALRSQLRMLCGNIWTKGQCEQSKENNWLPAVIVFFLVCTCILLL